MNVIKTLKGFSGSQVLLCQGDDGKAFVRKTNNVSRNYERLTKLKDYPVPKILHYDGNVLDMEYIPGIDMKTYLTRKSPDALAGFLLHTLERFSTNSKETNYTSIYHKKLEGIDFTTLPFTKQELIDKLPESLPQSEYFGDFTLDNIIYSKGQFYLIDGIESEYNSYIFDIAKLNQDLKCGWFTRNTSLNFAVKLNYISECLHSFQHADNLYLTILMLLRVYPYTHPKSREKKFIESRIQKLWK